MYWRAILLLTIGLFYYGYIRENTDRALETLNSWKMSYLTIVDQATAGQIPSTPEMESITVKNSLPR